MMNDDELRNEYANALTAATATITEGLDDLLDGVLTAITDTFAADPDNAPIGGDLAAAEVADSLIRLALIDAFAARDTRLLFAHLPNR